MRHFLLTWLGTAIAFVITSHIVAGFIIKSFFAALVAAIILGLVNAIIRPILGFFALPITLLTFGLFTFVINGLTLWFTSVLSPVPGFEIKTAFAALLGSIVLSIVSTLINYILRVVE
jgi:putative membrane protein